MKGQKKEVAKNLPAVEWDFRAVDDSQLAEVTLYEYARTSDTVKNSVCAWLEKVIKGQSIRAHLIAAHRKIGPGKFYVTTDLSLGFDVEMEWLDRTPFRDFELLDLIQACPNFPAPWLSRPPVTFKRHPDFSRVKIISRPKFPGGFRLDILWRGATHDEIVADFEKWLRLEQNNHPEMKRRGRAGQIQIAPLAWLAAYRFQKVGFTYEKSQEKLPEKNNSGHLPVYSEKSGWSDAIKKATQLLANLDAGKWKHIDP